MKLLCMVTYSNACLYTFLYILIRVFEVAGASSLIFKRLLLSNLVNTNTRVHIRELYIYIYELCLYLLLILGHYFERW